MYNKLFILNILDTIKELCNIPESGSTAAPPFTFIFIVDGTLFVKYFSEKIIKLFVQV